MWALCTDGQALVLGLFLDGADGLVQGVLGGVGGLAQGILGGALRGLRDHGDFLSDVLDRVVGLLGELVPLRAEEDVLLAGLRQQNANEGAGARARTPRASGLS